MLFIKSLISKYSSMCPKNEERLLALERYIYKVASHFWPFLDTYKLNWYPFMKLAVNLTI